MVAKSPVLASAQAQYPKSANKNVQVKAAWHPDKSTTGKGHPDFSGVDGWDFVRKLATRPVLEELRAQGYTWVNLENGGAAQVFKDVPISKLI